MECHLSRTRVHIDGVSLFGLKARGAAGVPGVLQVCQGRVLGGDGHQTEPRKLYGRLITARVSLLS